MTTFTIPLITLLISLIIAHVFLLHTGTEIGKKGRKHVLLLNIFSIAESILVFAFCFVWNTFSAKDNILYTVGSFAVGIAFLLSGAIGVIGIYGESSDALVTEELTDVHIVPAGYHNKSRKLEGTVGGKRVWFILRGADRRMAEQIKKNGGKRVTVTYHPSSRRIESIKI